MIQSLLVFLAFQSLSPGAVDTNLFRDCAESVKTEVKRSQLKPEDVADTICHLLSTPPSVNITELTIRSATH